MYLYQTENRIIANLERTADPNNYALMDEDDMDREDEDFDDDLLIALNRKRPPFSQPLTNSGAVRG